jgi:hypothetical protein
VDSIDQQVMFAEKSWGSYRVLDVSDRSMTVKVTLNPGHGMNYHSYERRDEVWTVRLFNITESGATVSAFFYSLVESCKVLDIRFQDYMTHVLLNANTIKDGDEEAWTALLPGRCDISDAVTYREQLFSAAPDPERTEPYRLRGKRV